MYSNNASGKIIHDLATNDNKSGFVIKNSAGDPLFIANGDGKISLPSVYANIFFNGNSMGLEDTDDLITFSNVDPKVTFGEDIKVKTNKSIKIGPADELTLTKSKITNTAGNIMLDNLRGR